MSPCYICLQGEAGASESQQSPSNSSTVHDPRPARQQFLAPVPLWCSIPSFLGPSGVAVSKLGGNVLSPSLR